MKRIGLILLGLILFTAFLHAEDVRYRRPLRIDQTWSYTFFYNTQLDTTMADTSSAVYVGDIYLPSLTVFYKGDDNVDTVGVAGDSLDVNISPDFWIPSVGWVTQDHNSINRMDNTSWEIFHDKAPPRIVAATVSNPDPGVDFTYTTNINKDDAVFAVSFVLNTSSTTANRYVGLGFKDSNGNLIAASQVTTAQPASKNIAYQFFPGAVETYSDNTSRATAPIPPNIRLRYGSEIYSVITNIDADTTGGRDQISSIVLSSLRDADIDVGFHTPTMADSIRFVASGQADNGSDCDIYLVATAMYLRAE